MRRKFFWRVEVLKVPLFANFMTLNLQNDMRKEWKDFLASYYTEFMEWKSIFLTFKMKFDMKLTSF